MKTRKECFDEARQKFIEENPQLVISIEKEAKNVASSLGVSEKEVFDNQISQKFSNYLKQFGDDTTQIVIKMMSPDDATKKKLLIEYYQELSEILGIPFDDFLLENHITL
ncbi:hypothetical protein ERD95_20130 [Enterobacteriaceae bacterium ML5]|nr:hypothetical protein ERD95_20130 [Enterobacteriaceae bacterium ML5]